jgi:succinyl-diaminopimelate desuccinylase
MPDREKRYPMGEVNAFLDARHEFVVELQRNMTALPAVGPDNKGEGENGKARYLLQILRGLGLEDIHEFNAADKRVPCGFRPNLAARVPGRRKRTLWIIGHMDVVPPGDLSLWTSSPYELHREGDLLRGRGVEDNQQAIVCALLAIKTLKELNLTPDLSLGVLFVSDEETHSKYGLEHVLRVAPHLIAQEDLLLVPDIGDRRGEYIEVAEKSCLWLKISISGKQCHASTPDEGINSLLASAAAILALDDLHKKFPQENALYNPARSTFVPSRKEANVENINTVPGLDVFYLDCRVLPEISHDAVINAAGEIVRAAAGAYGAGTEVAVVHQSPAPEPTSLDAPVVRRLMCSLETLRRLEPKPFGAGGQTVAGLLRKKHIPAAAWSTIMGNPHAPNETSSIINTLADAKIIVNMLFD